jgi:hypothetical protein
LKGIEKDKTITMEATIIHEFDDFFILNDEDIETISHAAEAHCLISTNKVQSNNVLLPWAG